MAAPVSAIDSSKPTTTSSSGGKKSTEETSAAIIEAASDRAMLRSAKMSAASIANGSRNEAFSVKSTMERDNQQAVRTVGTNSASDSLRQNTNVRQTLQVQ